MDLLFLLMSKQDGNKMMYKDFTFTTGMTIHGAIRLFNESALDKQILEKLVIEFNKINNNEVPKLGKSYKIPVL